MGLFDSIFGSKNTEERLSQLEGRVEAIEDLLEEGYRPPEDLQKMVLDILTEPKTTLEIAEELGKSRSWTSYVLNRLEKKGRVREKEMRGREILYERV